MKKNLMKKTMTMLLAFAMVLTSMSAFGLARPLEVNAAETLDITTIKAGDHIYMGKDNVAGYTGSPYWRVLDVDINNETAFPSL